MNLSKFIQFFGVFMTRKISSGDKAALLESLRVELIPVAPKTGEDHVRKDAVRQILSSMVSSLHRRGRPKKQNEEVSHAA